MPPTADFDWEREGATVGATLDGVYAIVVLGDDADATARVAMGIARAQARHRRVAVGDLLGEAPPIQSLVQDEVAHGITDSFVYGVSMTKIAYPVDEAGELFVMPSGTEPIDYDAILPNARWRRLASGFREVGALLVLAAPASARRIEELVGGLDGAVLVGEMVPRNLPVAQVLAGVRMPRATKAELPDIAVPVPSPPVAPATTPSTGGRWLRYLAAAIVIAIVAIVVWLIYSPMRDGPPAQPHRWPPQPQRRRLRVAPPLPARNRRRLIIPLSAPWNEPSLASAPTAPSCSAIPPWAARTTTRTPPSTRSAAR